jgi:hypothetical protein
MLNKEEILAIINDNLSRSTYSSGADGIVGLEQSLAVYLGNPDGTEVEGRSRVVSTDVADAIEWILPQIMKSFTQNNEVVEFDPVHAGDEKQALLESQYVYEVLMKQNDGFIILHQFVKDALMQRNGIIKVYYNNEQCVKILSYTGITDEQMEQLLAAEGVDLQQHTAYIDQEATSKKKQEMELKAQAMMQGGQAQNITPEMIQQFKAEISKPVMLNNVKVSITRPKGRIVVESIAPEKFRVNTTHDSINLDTAKFTAHVEQKTRSEVMSEYGLDLDVVKEMPDGNIDYESYYRFQMQDNSVFYDQGDSLDESQRTILVSECFLMMDIDQTGHAKLMKITVAGGDATASDIIKVEEVECMPWVSTTTFLMSHKWEGLSITDRLLQIQQQKTALLRSNLDNIYLQNNQRTIVIESQVNMSDLLVSRPGGVVRTKNINAIMPFPTPQIGTAAYDMMNYLDRVRAGRTGVDPDGSASPEKIGDRVGSQGVERMMNAKEELVGLIIRVVAETGIKPLCVKIRDLSIRHIDAVLDFRFRGQWQQINPAEWIDRSSCTVRVGTGTGDHMQQVQSLAQVITLQKEALAVPGQTLVNPATIFNALDDLCRFSGLNGANRYFLDPTSDEGKQAAEKAEQQSKEEKEKADLQNLELLHVQVKFANAEVSKAQTAQANVELKGMIEQQKAALAVQKQEADGVIASLKQQLEDAKLLISQQGKSAEIELRKYESDQRTAVELTRIETEAETQQDANMKQNLRSVQ